MAARSAPVATYHTLKEISETSSVTSKPYNLYAAVAESSAPARTRGTDCKVTLTLQDASQGEGITLILFAPDFGLLPRAQVGAIIRVHRAWCKSYKDMPQLSGRVKSPLQWCLYDPEAGGPTEPLSSSSDSYSTPPGHEARLEALRRYAAGRTWPRGQDMYLHRIEELLPADLVAPIAPDMHIDIVCRVLAVQDPIVAQTKERGGVGDTQQVPPRQQPALLWVWDGTDTCPFYIPDDDSMSDAEQPRPWYSPMPLKGDLDRGLHVAKDLPALGTALKVVAHKRLKEEMPELQDEPLWVKFRNVGVRAEPSGHVCVHYNGTSRWCHIDGNEDAQKLLEQRQRDGVVAAWADTGRLAAQLPRCHAERPYTTLRAIKLGVPDGQPAKFRCLARVVRYWPADVCEFCSRWQPEEGGEAKWVWNVKLVLEDATSELEALLWAEDADHFFSGAGLEPCNLHANPQVARHLQALMDGLCCGPKVPYAAVAWQSPPWIDCCLKSYFLDCTSPDETLRIRMFDTTVSTAALFRPQGRMLPQLPNPASRAPTAVPQAPAVQQEPLSNAFRFMS